MKYLSSRFEEYIAENQKCNLHDSMNEVFDILKIILIIISFFMDHQVLENIHKC